MMMGTAIAAKPASKMGLRKDIAAEAVRMTIYARPRLDVALRCLHSLRFGRRRIHVPDARHRPGLAKRNSQFIGLISHEVEIMRQVRDLFPLISESACATIDLLVDSVFRPPSTCGG
jgi:hypothetical protein